MVNAARTFRSTQPGAAAAVAGVDGCPAGWFALLLVPGGPAEGAVAATWDDLPLERAPAVAVDMPIGLTDRGPRDCDPAARRLLPRGRKSSVFPAPRRYMLACADWAEAHARGRAREGCGLSREAWNLVPRIRELDRALGPDDQARVREVHPELVFHRLNDWAPLAGKKTPAGRAARLRLLAREGLDGLEALIARFPRREVRPDDVLDAAACALAARAMLAGRAARLPDDPPRDARGLRMEIWY